MGDRPKEAENWAVDWEKQERAGASEAGNSAVLVSGLRLGWLRPAQLTEPQGFDLDFVRAPWEILSKRAGTF